MTEKTISGGDSTVNARAVDTAAAEAAKPLVDKLGGVPDLALVMGSGWVPAADALGETEAFIEQLTELRFHIVTADAYRGITARR